MQNQKPSNNNERAKMPGRFVTGRAIETKVLIRLLQEYDGCVVYIRNRMGREGFDTTTATKFINRCNEIEEQFKELVHDMKKFIKEIENKKKEKKLVSVEADSASS